MSHKILGQVVKVLSDNFYVSIETEVILCKERGKLRNLKTLPLVGDFVLIDKEKKVIEEVKERRNEIIRPPVANVTQALLVTSFKVPDFSLNLLDKLLALLEINHIKPIICLTKKDLIDEKTYLSYKKILDYYESLGYKVLLNTELKELKKILEGNTTVLIGQTGAGKSTLLNNLFRSLNLKTGEVSKALGRGRHTTRYVEIISIGTIKVLDTPGFSALSFDTYSKEDLKEAFIEFKKYPCKWKNCMHLKEEDCKVREAVLKKEILESRYLNYQKFINDYRPDKRRVK